MPKIDTNPEKIAELLTRGVAEVISEEDLAKKLQSGKQLRIKLGIDPTSPNIHLGRSVPLLKLRDFQNLGHKIVFIIGDFTGVIGDTSDKDSERPMLTSDVVKKNLKSYIAQASKIIDIKKTEIHYNSAWLKKLTYAEIGTQADAFSLHEFIARENIAKRLDQGKRISLRELLYPLMQGFDSVKINADVEIGGTDQKFNILAGRQLQKAYGQEPQNVMTNPIIEGLDGRKMSSSYGNTVNLFDTPNDMFGKLMSLKDEFIITYFILTTRIPLEEISQYEKELKDGVNPRDIKLKLAFEITKMYHDEKLAHQAQDNWISTFSKKETPDDMPVFKMKQADIVSVLVDSALTPSKSEARRAVEQGGVKVNGEVIKDIKAEVKSGDIVQKGKMHFIKVE
ncbi:MAG: tyrosyl-tRNA synthetase, tyrosyl-tRNA synthetase [Candidatus Parcubacteria bacterium]|jgi:tyrosyl-tRNA synthetase